MSIRAILIGFGLSLLLASGASASGMSAPSAYDNSQGTYGASAFNFDGFYLGAVAGGLTGERHGGALGVVAGSNFALENALIGGLEFQGDGLYESNATTYDFLTLGRLGVVLTDDIMIYADGGLGWVGGTANYALGGGAEFAINNTLSARGEILGLGNWGSGLDTSKITAGLLYHFH